MDHGEGGQGPTAPPDEESRLFDPIDLLLTFEISGKIRLISPPAKPTIKAFHFQPGVIMSQLVVTTEASPAAANVVHRLLTYSVGGGPTAVLDVVDPLATFSVNDGDVITATLIDVSNTGQSSPASDPFTATAVATIPDPPVKPSIIAFHFAAAPTPTPTP